jgi:hypothetical protein
MKPKVFPYVLVVNHNDPNLIQLNIISGNTLNAHFEKYGYAYYSYFGLLPKRNDLNINIFREYFQSKIGIQIIQLSLNGGNTKIKGKLKSLLIPATFRYAEAPEKSNTNLDFLNLDSDTILSKNIEQLHQQLAGSTAAIKEASGQYSWYILGQLSHFKTTLIDTVYKIKGHNNKSSKIIFENPIICNSLIGLKASSIYPYHADIFIEITTAQKQNIHLPLTARLLKQIENDQYYLSIESAEGEIVRLHSEKVMLDFIDFILQKATSVPISKILSSLKVPSLSDMKNVVSKYEIFETGIQELSTDIKELINQIFTDLISKQ